MPTPFLYLVVLYCLDKINGERTVYSIYHLLSGKKSSQTIQDAHLFQLTQFFKTTRNLSRQQFDDIVKELEKLNFITEASENYFKLTKNGVSFVEERYPQYSFLPFLNGWNFQQADAFWERLSLLVQVASHLGRGTTSYIPIQRNKNVQIWLKNFLYENKIEKQELSKKLYEELVECFESLESIDPSVLVIRLTGYNTIGLTDKQACESMELEPTLYHFLFEASLHYLMDKVLHHPVRYPLLALLTKDFHTEYPLTESTKKTYELLNKGYTLVEIGRIRKLKLNTIQDHIVELALQIDSFDVSPFVEREKIKKILTAKNKTTSKQLRFIRELVPDATYFELRLVMTKYGDKQ